MINVNEITLHRKIISETENKSLFRWKFIPRKYFIILSIIELDIYLSILVNLFIQYFINGNYVNILCEWYSLSELNIWYIEKYDSLHIHLYIYIFKIQLTSSVDNYCF